MPAWKNDDARVECDAEENNSSDNVAVSVESCTYTRVHDDYVKAHGHESDDVECKDLDGLKPCSEHDDDKDGVAEDDDEGLPIDRGWAWLILAALISMHVIVSLIGIRKTLFLGATITSLGMVTAIFATSIDFLIGTHSILLGIGNSMIYGPSMVNIGHYFKKRRGLASAAAMSSVSFGGSVFPPLVKYLLDEFGLRGTMIILTGITFNMFVGAAVQRPMDSFRKKKPRRKSSLKKDINLHPKERPNPLVINELKTKGMRRGISTDLETCPRHSTEKGINVQNSSLDSPFIVRRLRTESDASAMSKSNRNILLLTSQSDFGSLAMVNLGVQDIEVVEGVESLNKSRKPCFHVKKALSSLDFSLFKKPMFRLIAIVAFFSVQIGVVPVYIPALSKEKGLDQTDAALFLTIAGAVDFFCRLLVGFLIDLGHIKANTCMAIGLAVAGTITHFTPFYNSYALMMTFTVTMTMFSCAYFALINVAIIDFMGLDYLGKTLGFVSLFHGMSIAICHPIIGGIRDATGSYTWGMSFIGSCAFVGAALLFSTPLVKKCVLKPSKEDTLNGITYQNVSGT